MPDSELISRSLVIGDLVSSQFAAKTWYVDGAAKTAIRTGKSFDSAYATITAALNDSSFAAGDRILVAPGDYDETVTITKDNVTIIGVGARSEVSVGPSTANANAVVVDGTTASGRVEGVTLVNINCDGNGTGVGLHVKGNIRRVTVDSCKLEAGDTAGSACKLESTAAGSVGDIVIKNSELCWAQTGLNIDVTGGGDPVTEVYVEGCKFHNITANHVVNATASTAIIELYGCRFEPLEAGTAPTGLYIDLRAGTTTGGVYDCLIPAAVAGGKVLVDTGVTVMSRFTGGLNTAAPT